MYLKSFSFDMKPFGIIQANATYDIYGSVTRVIDRRFQKSEVDFAHGLKSFGNIVASAGGQEQFEIAGLKYNIIVGRKVYNHIRGNEHTSLKHNSAWCRSCASNGGKYEKGMTLKQMVVDNPFFGDQQYGPLLNLLMIQNRSLSLSLQGERIARFSVSGKYKASQCVYRKVNMPWDQSR